MMNALRTETEYLCQLKSSFCVSENHKLGFIKAANQIGSIPIGSLGF